MENQDNKLSPKPSDDAQSLVETIIPSTETEESKTTEVKHKISLETPQKPVDKKEEATEQKDGSEKEESVDEAETVENKTEETTDKDSEVKTESPEDESEEIKDKEPKKETETSSKDKKEGTDEGDKIETVAP